MHSPTRSEYERSLGEGFPGLWNGWTVAARYTDDDGVLRADGPVQRRYLPGAFPRLATELARVDRGGEMSALAFVRRWGLLGYAQLVAGDAALSSGERKRRIDALGGGDPIDWVRAHARGVRVCLDLLDCLISKDDDAEQRL